MVNVTVRLLDETWEKRSPSPSAESEEKSSPTPSSAGSDSAKSKKSGTGASAVLSYIKKNVIAQTLQDGRYYIGKYSQLTDNYSVQQAYENASSLINGISSIVSAGKIGMAMGGPVGAAVAVSLSAMRSTILAMKDNASAVQSVTQKAYDNYFYSERAGLVAGGHGTEN